MQRGLRPRGVKRRASARGNNILQVGDVLGKRARSSTIVPTLPYRAAHMRNQIPVPVKEQPVSHITVPCNKGTVAKQTYRQLAGGSKATRSSQGEAAYSKYVRELKAANSSPTRVLNTKLTKAWQLANANAVVLPAKFAYDLADAKHYIVWLKPPNQGAPAIMACGSVKSKSKSGDAKGGTWTRVRDAGQPSWTPLHTSNRACTRVCTNAGTNMLSTVSCAAQLPAWPKWRGRGSKPSADVDDKTAPHRATILDQLCITVQRHRRGGAGVVPGKPHPNLAQRHLHNSGKNATFALRHASRGRRCHK